MRTIKKSVASTLIATLAFTTPGLPFYQALANPMGRSAGSLGKGSGPNLTRIAVVPENTLTVNDMQGGIIGSFNRTNIAGPDTQVGGIEVSGQSAFGLPVAAGAPTFIVRDSIAAGRTPGGNTGVTANSLWTGSDSGDNVDEGDGSVSPIRTLSKAGEKVELVKNKSAGITKNVSADNIHGPVVAGKVIFDQTATSAERIEDVFLDETAHTGDTKNAGFATTGSIAMEDAANPDDPVVIVGAAHTSDRPTDQSYGDGLAFFRIAAGALITAATIVSPLGAQVRDMGKGRPRGDSEGSFLSDFYRTFLSLAPYFLAAIGIGLGIWGAIRLGGLFSRVYKSLDQASEAEIAEYKFAKKTLALSKTGSLSSEEYIVTRYLYSILRNTHDLQATYTMLADVLPEYEKGNYGPVKKKIVEKRKQPWEELVAHAQHPDKAGLIHSYAQTTVNKFKESHVAHVHPVLAKIARGARYLFSPDQKLPKPFYWYLSGMGLATIGREAIGVLIPIFAFYAEGPGFAVLSLAVFVISIIPGSALGARLIRKIDARKSYILWNALDGLVFLSVLAAYYWTGSFAPLHFLAYTAISGLGYGALRGIAEQEIQPRILGQDNRSLLERAGSTLFVVTEPSAVLTNFVLAAAIIWLGVPITGLLAASTMILSAVPFMLIRYRTELSNPGEVHLDTGTAGQEQRLPVNMYYPYVFILSMHFLMYNLLGPLIVMAVFLDKDLLGPMFGFYSLGSFIFSAARAWLASLISRIPQKFWIFLATTTAALWLWASLGIQNSWLSMILAALLGAGVTSTRVSLDAEYSKRLLIDRLPYVFQWLNISSVLAFLVPYVIIQGGLLISASTPVLPLLVAVALGITAAALFVQYNFIFRKGS